MAFFIDLALIVVLLVYLFNWAAYGFVPYWAVVVAVIIFCCTFIMRIFGRFRLFREPFGRVVRLVFTVGMPILAAYVLATRVAVGHQTHGTIEILMLLVPLYIVMLGFYIMVWGAFTSPRGILWNIPIIISIVTFIIGLAAFGFISGNLAALSMLALILILGIKNLLSNREKQTIRKTFSISMVLASLAVILWLSDIGDYITMPASATILFFIILTYLIYLRSRR